MNLSEDWLIALGIVLLLGCLWLARLFLTAPEGSQDRDGFHLNDSPCDTKAIELEQHRPQDADKHR